MGRGPTVTTEEGEELDVVEPGVGGRLVVGTREDQGPFHPH